MLLDCILSSLVCTIPDDASWLQGGHHVRMPWSQSKAIAC